VASFVDFGVQGARHRNNLENPTCESGNKRVLDPTNTRACCNLVLWVMTSNPTLQIAESAMSWYTYLAKYA
jgi:hypothetical protein